MIYFEIDGEEYTARITSEDPWPVTNAVGFPGPDGSTLWILKPEQVA